MSQLKFMPVPPGTIPAPLGRTVGTDLPKQKDTVTYFIVAHTEHGATIQATAISPLVIDKVYTAIRSVAISMQCIRFERTVNTTQWIPTGVITTYNRD